MTKLKGQQIYRASDGLTLTVMNGYEASFYWEQIAEIRVNLFKEFPYLYKGNLNYEKTYLDTYFKSPKSSILLVHKKGEIVGFSNHIPLSEEMSEIKKPFVEANLNLNEYLYIGEALLSPLYRGRGMLRRFFEYHECDAVRKGVSNLIFMTVKRALSHPKRPKTYESPDPMWEHFGYTKLDNFEIHIPWPRIDTKKTEDNSLEVWLKSIEK